MWDKTYLKKDWISYYLIEKLHKNVSNSWDVCKLNVTIIKPTNLA